LSQIYLEKQNAIAKRPPLRDLISSFLKANFTPEDGTIDNMRDATKDLDMCRKDCKRAFNMFWALYMIYNQRDASQGKSTDSPSEKPFRRRRNSHDSIFQESTQKKISQDLIIRPPMPRRRSSHDSIFPKPEGKPRKQSNSITKEPVPQIPNLEEPSPRKVAAQNQPLSKLLRLQSRTIMSVVEETLGTFKHNPFSIFPDEQKRAQMKTMVRFGCSEYTFREHQSTMKLMGEAWVMELMEQESSKNLTGKALSKTQRLCELQTTLLKLLLSGAIQIVKQNYLESTTTSYTPTGMDNERFAKEFRELQAMVQKATTRSNNNFFTIAFCGTVASGKCDFLNAFIGEPVLPTDGGSSFYEILLPAES
jgi:hypothetical protein